MTEAASACLERGDVTEAVRRYRMISAAFPRDPVARALLRELAETPVGGASRPSRSPALGRADFTSHHAATAAGPGRAPGAGSRGGRPIS